MSSIPVVLIIVISSITSVSNILEALPLPPLVTLSAFLSGRHRSLARPLNQGLPILPPFALATSTLSFCYNLARDNF
ncbi:hypothetical protein DM01DRAFT_1338895 [Hesseltinella vesiculosa]|uniref:Uncharacterized protein n=1 Tax=Hesseltinella vesiculosa TaxID=101127 RepID=A0A1X2G939_9FUNG|nr:hypothetical protein DM01DRAFT_1338895 [Hesseltinella vesiculosa]